MGRWSRSLASRFVAWLRIPPGQHWLDVGCGTGALVEAICRDASPASVTGCDPAAPFIAFAREQHRDGRASFVDAGAGSLPPRAGGYGCAASLLALNFLPDPASGLEEMRSLTTPRGTVAACVWDYGDGMRFLRQFWDAAVALNPDAREIDEGRRFPMCRPEALTALFRGAGLAEVRCEAIEIPTGFSGFDDYWQPLLGGTGPAPSYVASLPEDRRALLAQRLREALRPEQDGTLALTARAWAARGTA